MAKKKAPGHYCRVCGERKANEKFSGKGHAAHICKACAALPPAARAAEQALRRIEGMSMRHISDSEVNWLRNRLNDPRPGVQEAARAVHHLKFQRYERNSVKKGLTVFSLEFFLHGEVWNGYGEEIPAHVRVFADRSGDFRRINYATEPESETRVAVEKFIAQKFLKSLIHEWDALFWNEDLSDSDGGNDWCDDPCVDDVDEEIAPELAETAPPGEPLWSVKLELNNGKTKEITFYHQLHDAPQELFWTLMEFFSPEDEE